jgi:NADH:ubiquinone oxidoreductase subunit F (NADH-binding)
VPEYPIAVKTLNIAIEQARNYGLLGRIFLAPIFPLIWKCVKGAGAFVCGEETATHQLH